MSFSYARVSQWLCSGFGDIRGLEAQLSLALFITLAGDRPTDRREGCNRLFTRLELEKNAQAVVFCNERFLASRRLTVQNARALIDSERNNLLPWLDDELSQVFSPLQSAYQSFTNL